MRGGGLEAAASGPAGEVGRAIGPSFAESGTIRTGAGVTEEPAPGKGIDNP